jgi:ABC-type uncharacterized transport system substrate-binding protein
MRRREFITLIGGAALTWPFAGHAQQADRMRRIGVLIGYTEDDPETKARLAAFRQRLEKRGWSDGRNVHIETRFAGSTSGKYEPLAKELVATQPDVILAHTTRVATADIEHAIASLAGAPNGGLLLAPDGTTIQHRDRIVALVAKHRLPAVYPFDFFVKAGGLMSYGTDQNDMFRLAASYVDRILRGDKPADLPVQAPTKFETTVNIRTAKALDITVPPGLLVAADEVIE